MPLDRAGDLWTLIFINWLHFCIFFCTFCMFCKSRPKVISLLAWKKESKKLELTHESQLSKTKKFSRIKKFEIYFQSQTINSGAYFLLAHHSRDYHNVLTSARCCVVYWSWQLLDFCPFSFDSSRWCRKRDLSWKFYYSNSKKDRSTHIQASCTQLHHCIDMWNQLKSPTSMLCTRNFSSLSIESLKDH